MGWALAMMLAFGAADSPIKKDEVVVFFPTASHLDAAGQNWTLPVHGWIYEPEMDSMRRRLALGLLRRSLHLEADAEETALFKERARLFIVDNERGKKLSVKLGDRTYALDESVANGHFRGTIALAAGAAPGKDRWVPYHAVMPPGDQRTFSGRVQLLAPTGFTVISDIDDTIKVSQVRDKKALLANTFLREYQAVFGMPELFQEWARAGAAFHYVSASPWQLYQPLAEFFEKAGYPPGSFEMKDFRWKDTTFFNLLSGPEKYKPLVIEPILKTYPKRKFILVGDSGEKDPEIYGALARKFPAQITRILIRDVTGEKADAERYAKAFEGVPKERWMIFENPKEITGAFRELKN